MGERTKEFEEGLVNTFRARMGEYDKFSTSELGLISSIEASGMGNFIDPDTGKEYGFKLIIGRPGFYEGPEEIDGEEYEDEN